MRRRDGLVVTLTLVTGAIDAIGLLRLGGVFTSVMTGNMVLLGIATANHDASIAIHTGVAFLAYVVGSFLGARVAGHAEPDEHLWPRPVVNALALELALLVAFGVWWEVVGAAPSTGVAYALLGLNAAALGVQSSAVLRFGLSGLSTTYLTGTLTQFIAGLTKRGAPLQVRSALILLALIGGAAAGATVRGALPPIRPGGPDRRAAASWSWAPGSRSIGARTPHSAHREAHGGHHAHADDEDAHDDRGKLAHQAGPEPPTDEGAHEQDRHRAPREVTADDEDQRRHRVGEEPQGHAQPLEGRGCSGSDRARTASSTIPSPAPK